LGWEMGATPFKSRIILWVLCQGETEVKASLRPVWWHFSSLCPVIWLQSPTAALWLPEACLRKLLVSLPLVIALILWS
jgi:hypothetical protein